MYTMKKVLLLDASPLFRDFLKEKLTAESVSVEAVENSREAFSTLVTQLPDLIVLDVDNGKTIEDYLGFLNDKHNDPNTRAIPVIVAGPTIERERISALTKYGIVKYFGKPIKFDLFFDSVGRILHANFSIDTTPSLMEIHLNDDIIFVEMARGLNREKLIMLKYHLSEIIDTNKLANPKLIIMMTDLQLSFVDGSNLELLFDSVVADPRINRNNIKVLSLDDFTQMLIDGHPQYAGIEVVKSLKDVLPKLVDESTVQEKTMSDLVTNRILAATQQIEANDIGLTLGSDAGEENLSESDKGNILRVAIVDDDAIVRKVLEAAFATVCNKVELFTTGSDFARSVDKEQFDLVVLDIYMPDINGLQLLKDLQAKNYKTPIIVYSQAMQREIVVEALSHGAKSYLVKPQKPEVVLQKAVEILRTR